MDVNSKHPLRETPENLADLSPVAMATLGHNSRQRPQPRFYPDPTLEALNSIETLYLMANFEATDAKIAREATLAVEVFKDGHPMFFEKHSPLLRDMVWFFIAKFDFNIASESLPVHNTFESAKVATLRTQVVCSFIHQFEDLFMHVVPSHRCATQVRDANRDIFPRGDGVKMIRLGTTILYWYLKDLYVTYTGIRERKDNRTPRRSLKDSATLEASRRSIKTTIDYRSRFYMEDYGLSLTVLADTPPISPNFRPPLVRMYQCDKSVIGFDDADIDINLSKNSLRRSLAIEPRVLASSKKSRHHDQIRAEDQNQQEERIETTSAPSEELSDFIVHPQKQSRHRDRISNIIEQPVERLAELPSLGRVDYIKILDEVIEMAKTKYSERYGAFFSATIQTSGTRSDLVPKLISSLSPKVMTALQNGICNVEDLIQIGGDPDRLDCRPVVYLHILWKSDRVFWLYIGQSLIPKARISDHNSIRYRIRHPSLHYAVWDSLDDIKSMFVTLASFDKDSWPESQSQSQVFEGDPNEYMLNLLEMWMCCAFQTLGRSDLSFNESDPQPWAGRHLNIALPLWQRFSHEPRDFRINGLDRLSFQEHLFSPDPMIRSWAESLRDSYNALRNSPSLQIRSYYFDQQRRAGLLVAHGKVQLRRFEKYRALLGNGILAKAQRTPKGGCVVNFGDFFFTIRNDTSICPGDDVGVQAFLTENAHPDRYARFALETDPASRLLIGLTSSKWKGWLFSEGEKDIYKMNTLVDVLERISTEQSKHFERRWQRTRARKGANRQTVYT